MSVSDRLFENALVYKVWQRPFVDQKIAPLRRSGAIAAARRVLDVGCGPGTNTASFAQSEYVGLDINPQYVEHARRQFGREFLVADLTLSTLPRIGEFDFVLVNSLLHHIDSSAVRGLLRNLSMLLSSDGYVHVLDMVLPERRWSIPWILARLDRGDFARRFPELRALVDEAFEIEEFQRYPLSAGGVTLWDFVYFKGRSRRE